QVLDEGRLSDSLGHIVDFKNTIIILTSNLGANLMHASEDFNIKYEKVMDIINSKFKPEFLNRLDEIIMFNNLSLDDINKIVEINISDLQQSILTNHNITLKIDEKVIEYLAKISFDPVYGARPLKRIINSKLVDRLSSLIIKDEIIDGGKCTASYDEESNSIKIKFTKRKESQ
ncbi:MAG: AAA family ATPase, partial [Anaplasmataceae bacterium]|nr:AAA family ATPase [Anaplasmataceae bacterium]